MLAFLTGIHKEREKTEKKSQNLAGNKYGRALEEGKKLFTEM
jgi:hypothetical protein